jgi:hypothetical protein
VAVMVASLSWRADKRMGHKAGHYTRIDLWRTP